MRRWGYKDMRSIPVVVKNELCQKEGLTLQFERTVGQQDPIKITEVIPNEFYTK